MSLIGIVSYKESGFFEFRNPLIWNLRIGSRKHSLEPPY